MWVRSIVVECPAPKIYSETPEEVGSIPAAPILNRTPWGLRKITN